eukprot:2118624-Amphidinium_carterae.6
MWQHGFTGLIRLRQEAGMTVWIASTWAIGQWRQTHTHPTFSIGALLLAWTLIQLTGEAIHPLCRNAETGLKHSVTATRWLLLISQAMFPLHHRQLLNRGPCPNRCMTVTLTSIPHKGVTWMAGWALTHDIQVLPLGHQRRAAPAISGHTQCTLPIGKGEWQQARPTQADRPTGVLLQQVGQREDCGGVCSGKPPMSPR